MFTFGCSPVLDLDNARLFAQQFPHHPLSSIAYNAFILLSGLMSLYKVTLGRHLWKRRFQLSSML
jgi:hypothetical protein